MTGNQLVSPCTSEAVLVDTVWEVTIDHSLENAAVVACTSDMQHAEATCDVL